MKNNLFMHIKDGQTTYIITSTEELYGVAESIRTIDHVVKAKTYDSLIEMIQDDYMHSDNCMADLITNIYHDSVDAEDIVILLHWAGEEDMLEELLADKEGKDV